MICKLKFEYKTGFPFAFLTLCLLQKRSRYYTWAAQSIRKRMGIKFATNSKSWGKNIYVFFAEDWVDVKHVIEHNNFLRITILIFVLCVLMNLVRIGSYFLLPQWLLSSLSDLPASCCFCQVTDLQVGNPPWNPEVEFNALFFPKQHLWCVFLYTSHNLFVGCPPF